MECIKNEYPREDYYLKMQMDCRKVLVGYGRYLEKNEIKGQGTIECYEEFLNNMELIENENTIYDFVSKLETEEYKAILYNGQSPILKDDTGLVEVVLDGLNEDSTIEFKDNDVLVIHTDQNTIELKGYKDMSEGEIFARQYLEECLYSGGLIIKDSLEQIELREDNYRNLKDYYNKCKDIVNIRTVPEDSEYYLMNWDCIIVGFGEGDTYIEQIWQRG